MELNFTEEQVMLRDSVERWLRDSYSFEQRAKTVSDEEGWSPEIWRAFAEELGILGASFAEGHGGLGGGAVETMIVMEEFGKALVVEPFLHTVVIGGGFLKAASSPAAGELIAGIVNGSVRIAFAYAEPVSRYNLANVALSARKSGSGYVLNGHKAVVYGAPWSTHLVVTARTAGSQQEEDGISVFVLPTNSPGISRRDYRTTDGSRASELYLENVSVGVEALIGNEGAGLPLVREIVDEALVAVSAEAVGVMRQMHSATMDYARQRQQFGRPISQFQVLQHRMVDMFMEVEQAASMVLMATLSIGTPERAKRAAAAKIKTGKACRYVGQNAIQIHGGIGISDELAIGHYFKRATAIQSQFGSADHHLERYQQMLD